MNRYRLGISILLFWLMLLPLAANQVQAADSKIQLIIGGETYRTEVPPKIVDDRTLVPIRVIAEAFGAKVEWDDSQKKVKVTNESVELSLRIGNKKATVKGKDVNLDVSPINDNGRTLVPLRFIGESLGIHVGWDASTQTVVINQPYTLTANGKNIKEKVFNIHKELYFPLKVVSAQLGAELKESKQGDRLVMQDLEIALNNEGQKRLKLKKMDTGWFIPQSTLESELQASVTVNKQQVEIERRDEQQQEENQQEKLSQLQSVRESEGKVYIDFTIPTPSKHFFMSAPDRIVVDLPNMVLGDELRTTSSFYNGMGVIQKGSTVAAAGNEDEQQMLYEPISDLDRKFAENLNETTKPEEENLIKEIRYSQFSSDPETVRVVVELTRKVNYEMVSTASGYVLALKPTPKKEGFLVVIDPGHGGKDPGAKGVSGNVEKDLTLAVGNYLAEELKAYKGIQITQTRTDDTYPTLPERVQLANDLSADLFLSIHGNSFKPETRGVETYYFTPHSETFAKILHKHLLRATGFPDRKTKVSGFYVIKNTVMPSALVELGFLSNEIENAQLQDPEFQKGIAKALAEAIHEYYTSL